MPAPFCFLGLGGGSPCGVGIRSGRNSITLDPGLAARFPHGGLGISDARPPFGCREVVGNTCAVERDLVTDGNTRLGEVSTPGYC